MSMKVMPKSSEMTARVKRNPLSLVLAVCLVIFLGAVGCVTVLWYVAPSLYAALAVWQTGLAALLGLIAILIGGAHTFNVGRKAEALDDIRERLGLALVLRSEVRLFAATFWSVFDDGEKEIFGEMDWVRDPRVKSPPEMLADMLDGGVGRFTGLLDNTFSLPSPVISLLADLRYTIEDAASREETVRLMVQEYLQSEGAKSGIDAWCETMRRNLFQVTELLNLYIGWAEALVEEEHGSYFMSFREFARLDD